MLSVLDSVGLGWGLRVCLSKDFLGLPLVALVPGRVADGHHPPWVSPEGRYRSLGWD